MNQSEGTWKHFDNKNVFSLETNVKCDDEFHMEAGREFQSAAEYWIDLIPYWKVVFLVKNKSPLEACLVLIMCTP